MPETLQEQETETTVENFKFKLPGSSEFKELPNLDINGTSLQTLLGSVIEESENRIAKSKEDFSSQIISLNNTLKTSKISESELISKLQAIEEAQLTAEEQAKLKVSREIEKYKTDMDAVITDRDIAKKQIENLRVEQSISESLRQCLILHDPSQMKDILKARTNPTYKKLDDDKFDIIYTLSVDGNPKELSGTEALEELLKLSKYENQIKSSLKSGGGTSLAGLSQTGTKTYSQKDWLLLVSTAKPDDRQKLIQALGRGEIIVKE